MMNLDKGQYFMMNEVGSRIWELIEGNTWSDNFWGDCHCPKCRGIKGENNLGKLLMKIREDYKS